MDVNVKDIEEIVRFSRSMQSFLNNYLAALNKIMNGASSDVSKASNAITTMRNRTESAKNNLRYSEHRLEQLLEEEINSEEDLSSEIAYIEAEVEDRRLKYELAKQSLEEAESLVCRIKINSNTILEEIIRNRTLIQDAGHNGLSAIKNATSAIMQYIK